MEPVINARVALRCEISRGGFSDERVFRVAVPQGDFFGVASRRYCWDVQDRPLPEDQPPAGQSIQGKVAARVVDMDESDNIVVSVPDGQVITVSRDLLVDRPAEAGTHVPLGSRPAMGH